jgi:hypothetical protein
MVIFQGELEGRHDNFPIAFQVFIPEYHWTICISTGICNCVQVQHKVKTQLFLQRVVNTTRTAKAQGAEVLD